jgi:hypothetical protein
MLTNQVRELTHDLDELIRKHDGRDLTRAEIVRQLATEGCVLIEKDDDLLHLHRALLTAVEMAVDHPQTVDQKPERDNPWEERREARERLARRIANARDEALDLLDAHVVADAIVSIGAMVALQPDDNPVPERYRRAFSLLMQASKALFAADEEAAA